MDTLLTVEQVNKMSYTDFISFLQEENRPSGGKMTIREIAHNAFINSSSSVLEVGCTNGFSSIEISRITKCNVVGIDINNLSINNAKAKAEAHGLDESVVSFVFANADELPFADNSFDLVICGNALSFMEDEKKSLKEIMRVVKPSGFISIVPLWYHSEPDAEVVANVSGILGFNIRCRTKDEWLSVISDTPLELFYIRDYGFHDQGSEKIEAYISEFFKSKPYLETLPEDVKRQIHLRWKNTIEVFNENLKRTSFSIILLRKNSIPEEVEMFMSYPKILN